MSSIINADTTNGVVITSDTSGEIKLQSAGADIATVNSSGITMASGKVLAPTGPAFRAYMSSNALFTSTTTTKVTLDTEVFDTANCFASSSFTPNVAGYYLINGKIRVTGTGCTASVSIYKNGAQNITGTYISPTGSVVFSVVSTVVYLNGSTDYIELYGYGDTTSGNPTFQYIAANNTCEMSGCLVRSS